MKKYNIAILTESRYEKPTLTTNYVQNILLEDRLLHEALERKGFNVIRIDWATKNIDWATIDFAIFRSTWDYQDKFEAFYEWLDQVKQQTQLINPISTIRWNIDKHYLKDLADNGINIPKTIYIPKHSKTSLFELHQQISTEEFILKPTISAGAKHTYRLNTSNLTAHEAIFQDIIQQEDFMIQPLLYNVIERGEISLMVFGGQYTHAVLKKAKTGDFRVQDNWGGTVHYYEPTEAEMKFAEKVVAACSPPPVYARVDIANDNDGNITLMEAELIEPEIWLRKNPEAANIFATAIKNYINEISA